MKDLKNNIEVYNSLVPAARNASANGLGYDATKVNGVVAVVSIGALTDGTHTFRLEESDDNTTFTTVAAGDLIGSFVNGTANSVQRVGYIGIKRYVRVVHTVAGGSTGAITAAQIIGGFPRKYPLP